MSPMGTISTEIISKDFFQGSKENEALQPLEPSSRIVYWVSSVVFVLVTIFDKNNEETKSFRGKSFKCQPLVRESFGKVLKVKKS